MKKTIFIKLIAFILVLACAFSSCTLLENPENPDDDPPVQTPEDGPGTTPSKPTEVTKTVTKIFKELGFANAEQVNEIAFDDYFTVTIEKNNGGTSPKYYDTGYAIRIYGLNSVSLSPKNNAKINYITVVTSNDEYAISDANCTITNAEKDVQGTSVTLTPLKGNEDVILTNPNSSGQFRILSITVSYTVLVTMPDRSDDTELPNGGSALETPALTKTGFNVNDIPKYSGEIYVSLNKGKPYFTKNQFTTTSYEYYTALDSLGRCGVAVAVIGQDIMPEGNRGSTTGSPSGWHSGGLYNRSHLIGWQLTGENSTKTNLITGTSQLNKAMIPFENLVADYIKETNNHVLYRSTPVFSGNNLLPSGVNIEAYSIEDEGEGICFNIYIYNVHPDFDINYATGSFTYLVEEKYIAISSAKKIHLADCSYAIQANQESKIYTDNVTYLKTLIGQGYSQCGTCDPSISASAYNSEYFIAYLVCFNDEKRCVA